MIEKTKLPQLTVPYQVFLSRHRMAVLFGSLNVVIVLASCLMMYLMAREFARTHWVTHFHGGTIILSEREDIMDATDIHVEQGKLAAIALLNRGPMDWDLKLSLNRRFVGEARHKAAALFEGEAKEFEVKELHQKAEFKTIEVLETRNPDIMVSITGQLVRTGLFQHAMPFTEPMGFHLRLRMRVNQKITENGLFPLVVYDFDYVALPEIQ